jgi:uncharacterized protein YraI
MAAPAAEAAIGWTTGDVNMRTGPGTGYARILTIPAGSQVQATNCTSWCTVRFAGRRGFVSASYVALGAYRAAPPVVVVPAPLPRADWYYGRPTWSPRYRTWYAGRRWWYDRRWQRVPPRRRW